jgi:hypothetical protein
MTDGGNRRSNRQGGQNGGNPRGQRGQQPKQGQQPRGGQPPQGGRGQPPQDDSRFTRRQLLAGGGVAAAAAGGGWFFFLRGPSGAKGVADNYVNAIGNNDWGTAGDLFHEDSPVNQQISQNDNIDNYEGYLDANTNLGRLENLNPSVKNHIEFTHYPDYNEEAANDVGGFALPGPDNAGSVDEAKLIASVIEVDISTWYDSENGEENSQPDHLSGDTTTVGLNVYTVRSSGDWSIWAVTGL